MDLDACAACGITVVRVPAYSPYAVAEYTVALMLSLNRKIPRAVWRTRDGNFSLKGLMGFDMLGTTVGIIGTGKIVKILIHILRGLDLMILGYDLYPYQDFAQLYDLESMTPAELYHQSYAFSLHCPLTDDINYIIHS